jgi:hypothetical protein
MGFTCATAAETLNKVLLEQRPHGSIDRQRWQRSIDQYRRVAALCKDETIRQLLEH